MSEAVRPFPTSRQQIRNAASSWLHSRAEHRRKEQITAQLYSLADAPVDKLSHTSFALRSLAQSENLGLTSLQEQRTPMSLAGILWGMQILMPDVLEESKYMEDEARQSMAKNLLSYQLIYNEELDFDGGKDVGNSEKRARMLQEIIKPKAAKMWDKLAFSLRLAKPEVKTVIANFIEETKIVEDAIKHEYTSGNSLPIEKAMAYKSLVNAIYLNAVVATILDGDVLAERLQTPHEEGLSRYEQIQKKYEWLTQPHQQDFTNTIERSVLIMFNLAMAGQVDDDWYGRQVDTLLGVPSFASGALETTGGDPEKARALLKDMREKYKDQARTLGMDHIGAWLSTGSQEVGQWLMHRALKKRRYENEERVKAGKEPIIESELKFLPVPGSPKVILGIRDAAFANLKI